MTVSVKITRTIPLGVEVLEYDNVASFEVTDIGLRLIYNDGLSDIVTLSDATPTEWLSMNISAIKIGLKMEEDK